MGRKFRPRAFAGPAIHCEQLDGLKVAHVTDIHVGRVTPERIQMKAVSLVNEASPDCVVITGDFVCHSQAYLDQLKQVVESYDAPVFCVLGNHDYWSGADEVRRSLLAAGAEVLSNQNTIVTLGTQKLQLVGLDDAYTGHADVAQAVKGLRPGIATLGLSHIAEEADALWQHGVPLVLSGHTHAGQVTLARLHEVALGTIVGHKYIHGLYGSREHNSAVYVGAGVGAAVIPLRLGDRGQREVTFFELGKEVSSVREHHHSQPPHPGRAPSERTKARRRSAVAKKSKKRKKT